MSAEPQKEGISHSKHQQHLLPRCPVSKTPAPSKALGRCTVSSGVLLLCFSDALSQSPDSFI